QTKMSRPASRRDTRQNGNAQTARAAFEKAIHVRRLRGFEFRLTARLQRQTAQAVRHQENDLGAVVFFQITNEVVYVHEKSVFCEKRKVRFCKSHLGKVYEPNAWMNSREGERGSRGAGER